MKAVVLFLTAMMTVSGAMAAPLAYAPMRVVVKDMQGATLCSEKAYVGIKMDVVPCSSAFTLKVGFMSYPNVAFKNGQNIVEGTVRIAVTEGDSTTQTLKYLSWGDQKASLDDVLLSNITVEVTPDLAPTQINL